MKPRLNSLLLVVFALLPSSVHGQGYSPTEAVSKMKVASGLQVKLVASEPEIRQPILVKCDDRGRLWTIQYLQYPNPAGLKRVKVDRWSRTVYDRVPKPPPHGPRGADRITIIEDTNGDGRADSFKDFVDGLNLCTGLAFGHGGVFVLQVPYLLFYPDRDRDDVPDSDPEVLLTGFGMEDAQSLSNHLTWGPDGWLYGVNGSTTTCRIRGIEFQQGCWRYHPITKEFELFCEGGGNTFGLTFDENGNLFYSTNGGPFVHAVQGGYYYKSFGKHGPLHNLHAYTFFGRTKRDQVPGGPPTGGTIYLGNSFPKPFRGRFIAGNFLGHNISTWNLRPTGSTFEARYTGELLYSNDTWFGATDVCTGPDGSLYVCDFHDQRTSHPDPDARWDRSNGRIYRIEPESARPPQRCDDLRTLSSEQLVELLKSSNGWLRHRARVQLAGRRDKSILPSLLELARQREDGPLALRGLWALHVSGGLTDDVAVELLQHPYDYVRKWTVELLGNRRSISDQIASRLSLLAASEESVVVQTQLAASAKRLPAQHGLRIVSALMSREPEISDTRIRALLWWAVENWTMLETSSVLDVLARPDWWSGRNREIVLNLVRRFSAEGSAAGYDACLKMIESAPDSQRAAVHDALEKGLASRVNALHGIGLGGLYTQFAAQDDPGSKPAARKYEPIQGQLQKYIANQWQAHPDDRKWITLALRAEINEAYQNVLKRLTDSQSPAKTVDLQLRILHEFGREDCVPLVLARVRLESGKSTRLAALDVLNRFESAAITARLLADYGESSSEIQSRMRDVLLSRPESTREFLKLVESQSVNSKNVPLSQVRRIALHNDKQLNAIVTRFWGRVGPGTPEQKLALMRKFNNDLRPGGGDVARGRELFKKTCAICHKLFGEGNQIGPDLTNANRKDRAAMLAAIVDPSAVIRREYLSYVATTTSGRVLTGLLAEQDAASVTILDAKNKRTKIARSELESLEESPISIMPERQLEKLSPQQVRDLFRYLQN